MGTKSIIVSKAEFTAIIVGDLTIKDTNGVNSIDISKLNNDRYAIIVHSSCFTGNIKLTAEGLRLTWKEDIIDLKGRLEALSAMNVDQAKDLCRQPNELIKNNADMKSKDGRIAQLKNDNKKLSTDLETQIILGQNKDKALAKKNKKLGENVLTIERLKQQLKELADASNIKPSATFGGFRIDNDSYFVKLVDDAREAVGKIEGDYKKSVLSAINNKPEDWDIVNAEGELFTYNGVNVGINSNTAIVSRNGETIGLFANFVSAQMFLHRW